MTRDLNMPPRILRRVVLVTQSLVCMLLWYSVGGGEGDTADGVCQVADACRHVTSRILSQDLRESHIVLRHTVLRHTVLCHAVLCLADVAVVSGGGDGGGGTGGSGGGGEVVTMMAQRVSPELLYLPLVLCCTVKKIPPPLYHYCASDPLPLCY